MFVLFVGLRCSVVLQVQSPVTSGRLVAPPSVPTAWTRLLESRFLSSSCFFACRFHIFLCCLFLRVAIRLCSFLFSAFSRVLILRASLPRHRAVVMNASWNDTS